jgi:hypothetical protein
MGRDSRSGERHPDPDAASIRKHLAGAARSKPPAVPPAFHFTPSVQLGPVPPEDEATTGVTLPFTLSGPIHGGSRHGNPGVDFDVIGRGTMAAAFSAFGPSAGQPAAWELRQVTYFIEPLAVPEPARGCCGFGSPRCCRPPKVRAPELTALCAQSGACGELSVDR